jgi:hypothetical protein
LRPHRAAATAPRASRSTPAAIANRVEAFQGRKGAPGSEGLLTQAARRGRRWTHPRTSRRRSRLGRKRLPSTRRSTACRGPGAARVISAGRPGHSLHAASTAATRRKARAARGPYRALLAGAFREGPREAARDQDVDALEAHCRARSRRVMAMQLKHCRGGGAARGSAEPSGGAAGEFRPWAKKRALAC